jgi:hypothetical protein
MRASALEADPADRAKRKAEAPRSAAERQADHRRREKKGLVKPRVEFHLGDTADWLVAGKFLPQWDAENIDKVVAALQSYLKVAAARDV